MPRRVLLVLLVSLLALAGTSQPIAVAQDDPVSVEPDLPQVDARAIGSGLFPADNTYLRFMPFTNGGSDAQQVYSQAQAVDLARRFDVIVALRWTFEDYVPAMKAANPNLRLIVYMNGGMSRKKDQGGMPESWFLHDAAGKRVQNLHFALSYMDVNNTGWRQWTANKCAEWIRLSGYDGCYLDDLGAGNLGTNLSAWPIDPRTGRRITAGAWIGYAQGLVRHVKAQNSSRIVTSNGLNSGRRYFSDDAQSSRMLVAGDASQAEGWLRGHGAPVTAFPSEAEWKLNVDMLVDAARKQRSIFVATKIWTPASAAAVQQWRAYTYASLLLGTDGKQFLYFSPTGPGRPSPAHPWDNINIGRPTEAYAKRGGVYQRNFTAGRALVNPTGSSISVALGGGFVDLSGRTVTTITMGPNSGQILRTVGATTPPPPPTNPTPTPTPPPPPSPSPSPTTVRCNGQAATKLGTRGDDVIRGTQGRDVIVAFGGNDVIIGLGGNDIICAGLGNDKVFGGPGDDRIDGGGGRDAIRGDNGKDIINGGSSADILSGGAGVDRLAGGAGRDKCRTGGQRTDRVRACEVVSRR